MNKEKESCINCNTQLHGAYCHECGQKKITPNDKKISHFFSEFISSLFVADGKIVRTFKELLLRPGSLSRTYIEGNTKKFLSPLKLFFFANLIYFLFPFLNTFNTDLNSQITQQAYSPFVKEVIQKHLKEKHISYEEFSSKFKNKSNSYGKLLLIVLVVLQASFLKLLFLRNKKFHYADFLTASAYFTSFYILVLLVLFPGLIFLLENYFSGNIAIILNNNIFSLLTITVIIFYLTVFIKRAFRARLGMSIIKAILLAFFIIPSFIIYRFILFWLTFWVVS